MISSVSATAFGCFINKNWSYGDVEFEFQQVEYHQLYLSFVGMASVGIAQLTGA